MLAVFPHTAYRGTSPGAHGIGMPVPAVKRQETVGSESVVINCKMSQFVLIPHELGYPETDEVPET